VCVCVGVWHRDGHFDQHDSFFPPTYSIDNVRSARLYTFHCSSIKHFTLDVRRRSLQTRPQNGHVTSSGKNATGNLSKTQLSPLPLPHSNVLLYHSLCCLPYDSSTVSTTASSAPLRQFHSLHHSQFCTVKTVPQSPPQPVLHCYDSSTVSITASSALLRQFHSLHHSQFCTVTTVPHSPPQQVLHC
jgi:hypothetical protein